MNTEFVVVRDTMINMAYVSMVKVTETAVTIYIVGVAEPVVLAGAERAYFLRWLQRAGWIEESR